LASGTAGADDTAVAPEATARHLDASVEAADTGRDKALADLQSGLQSIWAGANLRLGTTAVYVVDAENGEPLYNVHDSDALNPASNVKLISTGTVLATLGPDWRFQTHVLGSAADASGVIHGGLYLHGNYDPTLGPVALEELATQLRAQGVTRVVGDIVLDDSLTRDTLALSKVRITVRGEAAGKPASVEVWPASNLVSVASNRVRSKNAGRSQVRVSSSLIEATLEGEQPRIDVSIRGTIRKGHTRVLHVPIRLRSTFTGSALQRALQDSGIIVDGAVRLASFSEFNQEEGRGGRIPFPLATHQSRDIASLVKRVNKRSLNHLSDRLVMSAARSVYGGPLEMLSAVALMKNWLTTIGIDAESVVLDSGSGLSYQTQLSAKQIVTVLRAAGGYAPGATPSPRAVQSFRESLALGGVDGTLRRRFRLPGAKVEGRVQGKTGTLTRVIALSGFITREDGRSLCFSIVTNGHRNHRKRTVRLEHEHMVAELDAFLGEIPSATSPVDVTGLAATPKTRGGTDVAEAAPAGP
jgi:D-alanyl-D-alanine carboxypeptidase/D-alanyl-D-alanine-endopeptidase (penicillin-binding protein 4)